MYIKASIKEYKQAVINLDRIRKYFLLSSQKTKKKRSFVYFILEEFLYINYFISCELFTSVFTGGVFHWGLSDSKFPWVSWTLLSILADLNNTAVWIVTFLHPIFNSSSPFFKALGTIPSGPITIGINVTLMFLNFLSFLPMSKYLSLFSLSLIFELWFVGTVKCFILMISLS